MNTTKKPVATKWPLLLGLAVVAVLICISYLLIAKLLGWFSSLENQVAASIVTASAVALISTAGLIISKHYEHTREITREHNAKKIPIYEELINFSFTTLFAEKAGQKRLSEQQMIQFFAKYIPKLVVWGDDSVIKSFFVFRDTAGSNPDDASAKILFAFEDVVLNIRKDLGHKDTHIKKGDILGLFVTDIKKYLT